MNTQYHTFIVRLRVDDSPNQPLVETSVVGSVQQAGLGQTRYFDSAEKFQQTIRQTIRQAAQHEIQEMIEETIQQVFIEQAQLIDAPAYAKVV